jgi:hypothetical protein
MLSAQAITTLHISEVESNGGVPVDLFELTNVGTTTINISGWKMLGNDDTQRSISSTSSVRSHTDFDDATQQGIGSFTINSNAPTGVTDMGTIYLVYDTFSCDITDAICNPAQIGFSELLSASAGVNIVGGSNVVPGPASIGLVATGLALVASRLRKARGFSS